MEPRLRVVWVVRALELLRGQKPQGGVQAHAVGERLDELEDAGLGLLPGGGPLLVDQLPFRLAKKLSTGALSQHCATRLMLQVIPCRARRRW
jgi:hypothetical protein